MTIARLALFLLILSLGSMRPALDIAGLPAVFTDLLFVVIATLLAVPLLRGSVRLSWHPLFGAVALYGSALGISALAAAAPVQAAIKLATQAYLLALPLVVVLLVDKRSTFRLAILAWLAGAGVAALVGALAVIAYFAGVPAAFDLAYHHFGTLPPGDYPRIQSTFFYPAMLCNYLTVSLVVTAVARREGWIGNAVAAPLYGAIGLAALFTLTPGLGGFLLAAALLAWLDRWPSRQAGALLLGGGFAVAAVAVVVAAVTPYLHVTAPFLITVPGIGLLLAPSVRLLCWIGATQTFLANPLFGIGIGANATDIAYVSPSNMLHQLGDAHNVFLNVAAQAGIVGLAALCVLIVTVARPLLAGVRRPGTTFLLSFAWLNAFAYQGLTGSYEDARHLWVLLGLVIASDRLDRRDGEAKKKGAGCNAAAPL